MVQTTFSSRDFNQHVTDAKKASLSCPVFITDRGNPSHVLLSIEQFKALTEDEKNIADLLAMNDSADIDFEPPKIDTTIFKPVEFD